MAMERAQLPIIAGTDGVRCRTGDAVVTTAEGGQLSAIRCIHAVGPIYGNYASEADADLALRGAYLASMARAKEEVSGRREGARARVCVCVCLCVRVTAAWSTAKPNNTRISSTSNTNTGFHRRG